MAKKYTISSSKEFSENINSEFCDTDLTEHEDLMAASASLILKEEIERQSKEYASKKRTRTSPPYITYEEEELIYIPVIFHIPHSDLDGQSDRQYTDEELHEIINFTNQMLAGTFTLPTRNSITGTPNIWTSDLPAAIDDPLHGIDSGIRLKIVNKIPKSMLNPMFQSHVFLYERYGSESFPFVNLAGETVTYSGGMTSVGSATKRRGAVPYETLLVNELFEEAVIDVDNPSILNTIYVHYQYGGKNSPGDVDENGNSIYIANLETPIITRLIFIENIATGDTLDVADFDIRNKNFVDFYDWDAMKSIVALNIDSAAVANLNESASPTEYFSCGPNGAIFRYNRDILKDFSNLQIRNKVLSLNQQDAGGTFADGTVYDVYNHLGVSNTAGGGTSIAGSRGYERSNQFENPWITDFITGRDHDTGAQYQYSQKNIMSEAAVDAGSKYDGNSQAFYNIPAFHIFMAGNQAGSQAQFPSANFNNSSLASDILHSGLMGWHYMASPKWKTASKRFPYAGTAYTASVLFHELGHTFGSFHTHQTTQPTYNAKSSVLPLVHTKKSLFSNADSYIPPFEYSTEIYQGVESETKDFKDITDTEKIYLHTMLSSIPNSITDGYTRKISVDFGSSSQNFSAISNYPKYLTSLDDHPANIAEAVEYYDYRLPSSNADERMTLKWWRVLNTYLGMSLELDSLWGDSYILLDDDGNNVNQASGGKPEFVVNPTTDLVDGILDTSKGGTYHTLHSHLSDINNVEVGLYSSALGGRVVDVHISDSPFGGGPNPYGRVTVMYENEQAPNDGLAMTYSEAVEYINNLNANTAFTDWRLPERNEVEGFIIDTYTAYESFDGGSIHVNGISDSLSIFNTERFYWLGTECRTSFSSWYMETADPITGSSQEIAHPNCTVCQDESSSIFSLPSSGAAWAQAGAVSLANFNISAIAVRDYLYPDPSASDNFDFPVTGAEVIPPNRKGPQITSRVPFCVPVYDASTGLYSPSTVFDPFWFANLNWRDPKSRAYPENWPVSKMYDEYDAEGNDLCPCLYAIQYYYLDGVRHEYTPISAIRTGFHPTSSGGIASQNTEDTATIGAPKSPDAEKLHLLVTEGYRQLTTDRKEFEADYVGMFCPLPWNNTSVYIDQYDNVNIESDHHAYPHGGFSKSSRLSSASYTTGAYQYSLLKPSNISSNFTTYQYHTGFSNSYNVTYPEVDLDHAYNQTVRTNRWGAISYPHSLDYYFKNTPFGYKPYPGGYGSDDPVHHMSVPFGVGYVGVFLNGLRYTIFNYDHEAIQEENLIQYAAQGLTGISVDQTMLDINTPAVYNAWVSMSGIFGNTTPDLPNNSNSYKGMNYLKFMFGSSDPASAYYNPYRPHTLFNLHDLDTSYLDGTSIPVGANPALSYNVFSQHGVTDYFSYFEHTKFFSGQSFTIDPSTGETFSLVGKETPLLGTISAFMLNNAMYYDKGQFAYWNFDSSVNGELHFSPCLSGFKNSGEGHWISESVVNPSPGNVEDADFVTRSYYSPYQIFRARAYLLGEHCHFYNILKFGDTINLRTEDYGAVNEAQNQLDLALNKILTAEEATSTSTILSQYDGITLFDAANPASCDYGHCAEATPFYIMTTENILCQNTLEAYIDRFTIVVEDALDNTALLDILPDTELGENTSALFTCLENPGFGCYFQLTEDYTNCVQCTEVTTDLCLGEDNYVSDYVGFEGNAAYDCAFTDTTVIYPSLVALYLETISKSANHSLYEGLFTSDGNVFHYGNLIAANGQLYENQHTQTIPLYYYGQTESYQNILASTKKFNKILENIIKFTSFAK